LFRERTPRIDERLAVAAGPVQKDQQWREFLRRIGNEEVIGSRASARSESLDGHLVCRRSHRRNDKREEANEKYLQVTENRIRELIILSCRQSSPSSSASATRESRRPPSEATMRMIWPVPA